MRAIDASELGSLDAVETARRIARGELKASEAVDAAIERARLLEPELNAIPRETYEDAARRASAPPRGPFAGVPTFVKAIDDVAGVENDHASRALAGHVPRRTEPYIARYLETGLVSLGRSASPETGLSVTTESLAHGPTRNPWQLAHSTGGSSGGAAALVAARVVPIAQGSDAAGSIRIPASACGLVGLKPSRGRGMAPLLAPLLPVDILTYGVLTRTVRDTAHFLAAIEARLPKAKLPPIGLVEEPASARLRIAMYVDPSARTAGEPEDAVDPEVRRATLAAADKCRALGHTVEEIPCPYDAQLIEDVWQHIGFLAWGFIQQTRLMRGRRFDAGAFEPWTRSLAAMWKASWRQTLAWRRRLRTSDAQSAELYARYDALLCPTLATPPPEIGHLSPDLPFEVVLPREKRFVPFTPIQNVTGDPAISLPLGTSRDGLPIGSQLAGPPGSEARLLGLAYELERAGAFEWPA